MKLAAARLLIAGLAVAWLVAADPPPPPDPFGLGERLALIEHLRETYGMRPPPGRSLEELRADYAAAWAARQPLTAAAADPGRAERIARLRRRLLERHGVEAAPGLDEAALQEELRRRDAQRAQRDAVIIAALVAADQAAPRAAPAPSAAPAPAQPAAAPSAAGPTPAAEPPPAADRPPLGELRRIPFAADGVVECVLASCGERRLLLVTLGADHNGAFTGIREGTLAIFAQAPAIQRAVLLLGHGGGNAIAGESIAKHLSANKAFYESMGGCEAVKPVDCMVLAACAGGGQSQMAQMRDGLGYYPTWRVASGDMAATTGLNVLAAFAAIAARPAQPAWRGAFRLRHEGLEIISFGDVGVGGERAPTESFRIVRGEDGWRVEEQR